MTIEELNQIKNLPKVILHLHLDGSLRVETVYNWLKEQKENISLDQVKKELMVDKNCRDLNEYLQKFDLPLKVLQTKEHLKQATYELFEDLKKENAIYAEVRFAPSFHTKEGLDYDEVVESVIEGMNKAKEEFKIDGNIILCCMRGKDNEKENLKTIETARKYLNKGVCAIDLAGAEALYKTSNFEDIFKVAKELNIPFTIHAGEADGKDSIKKALEFGAKRIGHGIRCLEDDNLVDYLKENKILLEVCPISNLQTKATEEPHPIEKLYKRKIKVNINPDNNTVSNTSIIEEYKYVLKNTDLTINDLKEMNINGAKASFTDDYKKEKLIEIIKG